MHYKKNTYNMLYRLINNHYAFVLMTFKIMIIYNTMGLYILRLFKICILSYYSTSSKWLSVECYLSVPCEANIHFDES